MVDVRRESTFNILGRTPSDKSVSGGDSGVGSSIDNSTGKRLEG